MKHFIRTGLCALALLGISCSAATQQSTIASPQIDLEAIMQQDGYDTIKLDKIRTGHDVINVQVNGVDGRFILDTGASYSVLNERLRSQFKFEDSGFVRSEEGAGAGGTFEVDFYNLDSMTIGPRKIDLAEFGSMDVDIILGRLSAAAGYEISGIIGQDVILQQNGILDVQRGALYVRKEGQEPDCSNGNIVCETGFLEDVLTAGYIDLPITKLSTGKGTVTVEINGNPGIFIIDSGAGATYVNRDDNSKFDLTSDARTQGRSETVGASSGTNIENYRIESFTIEGRTVNLPSIGAIDLSAVEKILIERANTDIDGVIGQDILSQHYALIDVPNARIFLYGLP